jgi:hypothetical protein
MSYPNTPNNSNNNDYSNSYPAAPKKAKSPWLYVGLGCLGLFVLTFGGCAVFVMSAKNKIEAEMKKPLDKEALKQEMGDIPVYPNATLDEKVTKATRAGVGIMSFALQGKKMSMAAYSIKEPIADALAWYDQKMPEAGYAPAKKTADMKKFQFGPRGGESHIFVKDREMVQVQSQEGKSEKNVLIVMRMTGFTKEELKELQ